MRFAWLTILAISLLLLAPGCGSGDSDFQDEHTVQVTIKDGALAILSLISGARVTFPAGSYLEEETVTTFSDNMSSSDGMAEYFPTTTKLENDLVASVVINTPIDREIQRDITVTFAMREEFRIQYGSQMGEEFVVYRFDFDNLVWNRWGSVTATFDGSGGNPVVEVATATLPTEDLRGFIGSLALFRGHTLDVLGAPMTTTISGTVRDNSGNAIANIDVGVYVAIGSARYPAAVPGGRVPTGLPLPTNDNFLIITANTVDTDGAGQFVVEVPENLIGQRVGLRFGHEHPDFAMQDTFDILPPGDPDGEFNDVDELTVLYGDNFITPLGVFQGTD